MLQFAVLHPDEYDGRFNAVGIFQSGWLEREVQITGRSKSDLLLSVEASRAGVQCLSGSHLVVRIAAAAL